jgi:hypothetical protein
VGLRDPLHYVRRSASDAIVRSPTVDVTSAKPEDATVPYGLSRFKISRPEGQLGSSPRGATESALFGKSQTSRELLLAFAVAT